MYKTNKKHLIFFLIVFFIFAHKINASVIINEVQISPTEDRFVELYNNGSSEVDLTDWYIQRKTGTGSTFGSLVSKTNFEGETIAPNGYFVISKTSINNSDILVDSLTLTESNIIQLKNANQEVVDKVGWGDVSDCGSDCASNPTSGKSIQRVSGNFVVASPTPGEANNNTDDTSDYTDDEDDDSSNNSNSSKTTSSSNKEILPPLKIITKINIPKVIVARAPFVFDSLTTTNRKETYEVGRFLWNFGDGMVIWTKESGPFEYIYEYPGEYVMTLSYFDNSFAQAPDAIDRIVVKVVDSGISISSVGGYSDPYIEIENKSGYEIDISGWIINAQNKIFTIPDGMNILSNKKVKLSPKITGFTGEDISNVLISNPSGEVVALYPVVKRSVSKVNTLKSPSYISSPTGNEEEEIKTESNSNVINLDDLEASAGDSMVKIPNSVYPIAGMFLVLGIGIASFFSIKRKDEINDDIESGISADDIKIIE